MNAPVLFSSLFALGCGLLPAQAPQLPPQSAADLLPASTFAAVQFAGIEACAEAAEQLPMGAVIREFLENVPAATRAEHLDEHLDRAAQHVRQTLKRVGIAPQDLQAFLGCKHAIGIGRPTIEGMGPSFAWLVETGGAENEAAFERLISALAGLGQRAGAIGRASEVEIDGAPFRLWRVQGHVPVFVGKVGSHMVVTNSRGYVREIGAVVSGQRQSLQKGSSLGRVQRMLGDANVLASVFANTKKLCSMADPVLPYEISEWSDVLGLGKLDGIYAATAAGGDGAVEMLHIGMNGSPDGLFKVAASKPLDFHVARCFSENTVAFAALRCNVPGLIEAFDRFVDLLPAEAQHEIRHELHREFGRELRRAGSSPEELHKLLDAFGDQIAFGLSLEPSAVPKPEMLVRISVNDAAPISNLLQRFEALLTEEEGLAWKSRNVDGTTVRFVNVNIQNEFKLSPCYALTEDALMIGSDTAALVRALRSDDPEESLWGQDDFESVRKDMKGAFGVLHLRLFRASELGWRTVETMAFPQIDAHADELGFDSDALPDQDQMSEALGCTTIGAHVDAKGYTLVTTGLLGNGPWLALFGRLADEVLARASRTQPKIY